MALLAGLTVWSVVPSTVSPARGVTSTITVTTTDDELNADGDCSLREAVRAANQDVDIDACERRMLPEGTPAGPGPDEILVPPGIYYLIIPGAGEDGALAGDLDLTSDVMITGAGAAETIIDGGGLDRVVHADPFGALVETSISGVTIRNGATTIISFVNAGGGGVRLGTAQTLGSPTPSGRLTLSDCIVENNGTPRFGGGIANNAGTLTLQRTIVRGNNTPDLGGGIHNGDLGTVTLIDSTLSGNSASQGGGISTGLFDIGVNSTAVTLVNSTVSGNTCVGTGGGIDRVRGALTLINSTVSGNVASVGGGVYAGSNGNALTTLNNCTIAGNTASSDFGGGVTASGGPVIASNTVLAGNISAGNPSDCYGSLASAGYNLIEAVPPGCFIGGDPAGNLFGVDAMLGPLADNGGPTTTHALLPGSPAINAGRPAPPGGAADACAATDQRGVIRPLGSACDIGTFELSGGFLVSGIRPDRGGSSGSAAAIIFGSGFDPSATVKLARVGQPDIPGAPATFGGESVISATFDLSGRELGPWDVVVTNPDATSAALPAGFTIEETQAPQLFVQILGRSVVRIGRAEDYFVVFGNRGNVDANGVALMLNVPAGETLDLPFPIAPPPVQVDQVSTDWTQAPIDVLAGDATSIPFLLPLVPAGFTGALHLRATIPPTVPEGADTEIDTGIDPPFFKPELDAQVIADLIEAARTYAADTLGVVIPAEMTPELEQYLVAQLQSMVEDSRRAWVDSVGTQPAVYSLAQLVIDVAQYGVARTAEQQQQSAAPVGERFGWAGYVAQRLVSILSPRAAHATCLKCRGYACEVCLAGTTCSPNNDRDCNQTPQRTPSATPPPGSSPPPGSPRPTSPPRPRCWPPYVEKNGRCVPERCLKQPANLVDTACDRRRRTPVRSIDPNDKTGNPGTTEDGFVPAGIPLGYVVHFENQSSATAPAQEVVVTDQLDIDALDLDTFALGPVTFDTNAVPPPAGAMSSTVGLDLRPVQDLLVVIDVALDKDTGIATWRLHTFDPLTLRLPDDPFAGFLPPNVDPPEGEGSVQFTVRPKAGLATGTRICNQARIVFDDNAPIDTAPHCNTIDVSPPESRVLPLPPTQTSTEFPVEWQGTDQGAGIARYTVYVAEDGGPFLALVSDTTEVATTFTGEVGKTYAFCSFATDLVGIVERKNCPPDADTTTRVVLEEPTATDTASPPPTDTPSATATETATDTPSATATSSLTATPTESPTPVPTLTATATASATPLATDTPTAPPAGECAVSASPSVLWPPNHRMVAVLLSVVPSARCDPASCRLVSISSSEPVGGPGHDDTAPDWQVTGPLSADLRAERSGSGRGRVYVLGVECVAPDGNPLSGQTTVKVPRSVPRDSGARETKKGWRQGAGALDHS